MWSLAHACFTGTWLYYILVLYYDNLCWEEAGDYYTVNAISFTMLVLACSIRCASITAAWDWPILLAQFIAAGCYIAYLVQYSNSLHRSAPSVLNTAATAACVELILVTTCGLLAAEWLMAHSMHTCSSICQRWRGTQSPLHQRLLVETPSDRACASPPVCPSGGR